MSAVAVLLRFAVIGSLIGALSVHWTYATTQVGSRAEYRQQEDHESGTPNPSP